MSSFGRRYVQFSAQKIAVVVEWSQIKLSFELGLTVTEISTIKDLYSVEKGQFCLRRRPIPRLTYEQIAPESRLGINEGGEFQFLLLYYPCFLYLYPVLEQKIKKRAKKILHKNPPENPPRAVALDANANANATANANDFGENFASSSDHRLSSVLS